MNKPDLAKGLLTVPSITTWVDLLTNSAIWQTISNVVTATWKVLETGNSLLNPLFSTAVWWASAWLLTNTILKDFWLEKQWLRYSLTWAATLAWLVWWSVLAPYLAAWWLSYALWKHGWKYWKEAGKRVLGTAWWLTWWVIKWAAVWWYKSIRAWVKWEQKLNPVI